MARVVPVRAAKRSDNRTTNAARAHSIIRWRGMFWLMLSCDVPVTVSRVVTRGVILLTLPTVCSCTHRRFEIRIEHLQLCSVSVLHNVTSWRYLGLVSQNGSETVRASC